MTERTLTTNGGGIATLTPTLEARVFSGKPGLHELANDWEALCERLGARGLMQSPNYYLSYADILVKDDAEILAVGFFDQGQLVAVLPLRRQHQRRFGLSYRKLSFPNTPIPVRSYVTSEGTSLEDLVAVLKSHSCALFGARWDVLQLDGLIDYEPASNAQSLTQPGVVTRRIGKNNYIDVTQPDYVRTRLSGNMRSNLKRRMKRLASMGEYRFETVIDPDELDSAFGKFVDTEAAGWKSYRGGKRAIKLHDEQRAFYCDLLNRFSGQRDCHIHLLELNGQCIAADFVLISGDTANSLKHGYDEDYSDVTPSNLLREFTIEFYHQHPGIRILDLVSGYDWQDRWKPAHRPVLRVNVFNRTLKGWLLGLFLRSREWYAQTAKA